MRLLINFLTTLFFPIVKYTVKVYTPDSHVRSDYELTLRIKGPGKHKTADHGLYETEEVRERYDHVLSAYKSHIKKIQTKQNHAIRLIFFARTLGKSTESALPLLNLLDVLTVNNIYRLHILKFTHLWHKGLLPTLFQSYFQYASSFQGYNTRYASKQNLYKPKERTNSGKQTVAFAASVLWDDIPVDLKKPKCLQFFKKIKTLSAVRTTFWNSSSLLFYIY